MILPAFEPRMLTSLILLLISGCSSMVVVDDGDSGVALADGIEPEATVLELPLPLDRVGDGPPALPDATDLTDAASLTVDALSATRIVRRSSPLPRRWWSLTWGCRSCRAYPIPAPRPEPTAAWLMTAAAARWIAGRAAPTAAPWCWRIRCRAPRWASSREGSLLRTDGRPRRWTNGSSTISTPSIAAM